MRESIKIHTSCTSTVVQCIFKKFWYKFLHFYAVLLYRALYEWYGSLVHKNIICNYAHHHIWYYILLPIVKYHRCENVCDTGIRNFEKYLHSFNSKVSLSKYSIVSFQFLIHFETCRQKYKMFMLCRIICGAIFLLISRKRLKIFKNLEWEVLPCFEYIDDHGDMVIASMW